MAAEAADFEIFSFDSEADYNALQAVVETVQAQGIPVDIERQEDGTVELKLIRYFV